MTSRQIINKISFRLAALGDWQRVWQLEQQSGSKFFMACQNEEGVKKYLAESQVFFITKNRKPIGTISYKNLKNNSVLINGLTILPTYRGRGIASAAIKKLLNRLKGKNMKLVVHPQNTPALLIYLRAGFIIESWQENYFGNGQPRLLLYKKPGQF